MHRVSSAINWSAAARYMTSNNYRKWNLVGGRGGPPEQLVDSDSQPRYIYTHRRRERKEKGGNVSSMKHQICKVAREQYENSCGWQ